MHCAIINSWLSNTSIWLFCTFESRCLDPDTFSDRKGNFSVGCSLIGSYLLLAAFPSAQFWETSLQTSVNCINPEAGIDRKSRWCSVYVSYKHTTAWTLRCLRREYTQRGTPLMTHISLPTRDQTTGNGNRETDRVGRGFPLHFISISQWGDQTSFSVSPKGIRVTERWHISCGTESLIGFHWIMFPSHALIPHTTVFCWCYSCSLCNFFCWPETFVPLFPINSSHEFVERFERTGSSPGID